MTEFPVARCVLPFSGKARARRQSERDSRMCTNRDRVKVEAGQVDAASKQSSKKQEFGLLGRSRSAGCLEKQEFRAA